MKQEVDVCSKDDINRVIEDNMGFIIKTISEITKTYISLENDETFSIGLLAFAEAYNRFDESKGNFYPYAKLVIESRLKTYLKNENKKSSESLDHIMEEDKEYLLKHDFYEENEDVLVDEINDFKDELERFGITMEKLVEFSPKHRDTRMACIELAKIISNDEYMVDKIYKKMNLPIKETALRYHVSEKFVKGNKIFILGIMIVFFRKFRTMTLWIREVVK